MSKIDTETLLSNYLHLLKHHLLQPSTFLCVCCLFTVRTDCDPILNKNKINLEGLRPPILLLSLKEYRTNEKKKKMLSNSTNQSTTIQFYQKSDLERSECAFEPVLPSRPQMKKMAKYNMATSRVSTSVALS